MASIEQLKSEISRGGGLARPNQFLVQLPSAESRALNILHLPGHSTGYIGLLDLKSKELFSGDALYDGEILDNLYHSDPKLYEKTLSRIIKLDVNIFHGGHFPSFGKNRAKEIINNYFFYFKI